MYDSGIKKDRIPFRHFNLNFTEFCPFVLMNFMILY